jgi:formate dehydrogenase subunit gamma
MKNYFSTLLRCAAVVLFLGLAVDIAPSLAQAPPPANDAVLLNQLGRGDLSGRITIPDAKAARLQQPEGREWREMREGPVKHVGGWFLVAVVVAMAAFFAWRGRVRIENGAANRTIERFGAVERFTHWLTAVSFIVLGISGLNLIYGRYILLPLIGPEAFTAFTQFGKLCHNFLSFPFVLGVLLMLVMWIAHNLPDRTDVEWFKQGGGVLKKGVHPPSRKFNAGQKLVFWAVILGGIALAVTGYILMFPFQFADMGGMQLATLIHAIVAILLVAVILGHIYIGTVGMEGPFDAMGTGQVDINWAREHHRLWVDEAAGRKAGTGDD